MVGIDPLSLIVAALAVYRLAWAITRERGPFDVFTRMQSLGTPGGWVNDGLNCPLCVGFWLGIVAFVLLQAGAGIVLVPFAISGAASFLAWRQGR